MGVYIKGMEMPKDGNKLYMITFSDGKACASYKPFEWHEVAPAPPHGRCIDADALIDKIIAKYLDHERKGELVFAAAEIKQNIIDLISDAPTIIPAEEGE